MEIINMPRKSVIVIHEESGNIIAVEDIILDGLNYEPTDKEFFDLAWENVVEDGLAAEGDREKHLIRFK